MSSSPALSSFPPSSVVARPSSEAEKELEPVKFPSVASVIVGNEGLARGGSVGAVGVEGFTSFCSVDFVGLAVGVLVGNVPGATGGHVFFQVEYRLQ